MAKQIKKDAAMEKQINNAYALLCDAYHIISLYVEMHKKMPTAYEIEHLMLVGKYCNTGTPHRDFANLIFKIMTGDLNKEGMCFDWDVVEKEEA